jgi:hypothetical protein
MKGRRPLFLLLFLALLPLACDDDASGPEPSIFGSWVRDVTDAVGVTFTAEMRFNNDNSFDFVPLTNAPGHSSSSGNFTLSGRTVVFPVDADCPGTGIYDYVVTSSALALVGVEDDCGPRQAAIQGVWEKK